MTRKVFFSFHHKGDILKVGQVRNSWLTKGSDCGFVDAADWESIKRQGDEAVKRWINNQLNGTSVTVVLIGEETSTRPWVLYEIKQSHIKGNGLLGIYIHGIKDLNGKYSNKGKNHFDKIRFSDTNNPYSKIYPVYDWVTDNGYNNLSKWIEDAAHRAGR